MTTNKDMNTQLQAKPSGMQGGAQMRITEDERRIIAAAFKDNEALLRLMRKVFLPELDPTAPIGQMIDLWLTVDTKDMTPDMVYVNLQARNKLIQHVDQQLMTLKLIADAEQITPEQVAEKAKADSAK